MSLLEKTKDLKVGDKITLGIGTIFGGIAKHKATYRGNLRHHGYISNSGSWGLYDTGKFDETPCYCIDVQLYKKRSILSLNLEFDIKEIEVGW